MNDDSLEQPSPLRVVPSCATGGATMSKGQPLLYHLEEDPAVIALRAQVAALEQECEREHCEILVCTECGRTSKHGWIGVVYESTPNSAEEYDTECPECGSMSLDEDARSVVNELDTCKAQVAALEQDQRVRIEALHTLRMGYDATVAQLEARLAALVAERDEAQRKYALIRDDVDYQQCCAVREQAEQERDQAQAMLARQKESA